jgi:RNA ligase (TIGR02306 family)
MRQLATVERIDEVLPIEGADAIVLVKIKGWQCIALKEEFKEGDLCIYFEIDSWIPRMPQVEHLYSRAGKKFNNREGIRIKTIKLRGQLSQGLALPVDKFFELFDGSDFDEGQELCEFFFLGNDVSELIGVEKFELPIPKELEGQAKGNYPTFMPKTAQERCQNIASKIFDKNRGSRYERSMKMDGTSFSAYHIEPELTTDVVTGVCSRNWDLEMTEENAGNYLVRMFVDSGLQAALHEFKQNLAVQGELMGPGVGKNRESLASRKLFVFDIFDIDKQVYLTPKERHTVIAKLHELGMKKDMVESVPVLDMDISLEELGISDTGALLLAAEGPSLNHKIREGDVYKSMDGKFSFKVISNKFLLKEED